MGFIALAGIAAAFIFFQIYLLVIAVMLFVLIIIVMLVYRNAKKRTNDQMVIFDAGLVSIEKGQTSALRWEKNAIADRRRRA